MKRIIFYHLLILFLYSCGEESIDNTVQIKKNKTETKEYLFTLKSKEETGISFVNSIVEDRDINVMMYEYLYNGGGVGIGDFNNDGLQDVFFTGNQVNDKLYINKGNLEFEDISQTSGIQNHPGWSTGVSVIDINQDGWQDIYVCRSGPSTKKIDHKNLVLMNNGDGTFTDKSNEMGLAYYGYSTQAAFFDMDNDGDLDMYLVTHPAKAKDLTRSQIENEYINGLINADQLYRNDDGFFHNITREAKLFDISFGLGISITDFNDDGLLDIYVCNDYAEGDMMYINLGDGTFRNKITKYLKHTSNYSMGVDIADYNNDGAMDIFTVDMAFETHQRSKRNMASMDSEKFYNQVNLGWHYQYMHNNLHLNNKNGTYNEIAQAVGVNKTDWSWATFFADFDNDGLQDLFVSNGFKRDINDNDFEKNGLEASKSNGGNPISIDEVLNIYPSEKIKNYIFKNKGNLLFERNNQKWGLNEYTNSNGAAYADLDNDGDLDLIVNNMDEIALVYENTLKDKNYLVVNKKTPNQIKVEIRNNGVKQVRENYITRGYQSSVDNRMFFGFPDESPIDSIIVYWSKSNIRLLKNVKKNQFLLITEEGGEKINSDAMEDLVNPFFSEVKEKYNFIYQHKENPYDDYKKEILIPHKYSELGPFLSTGDILNNGLKNIFVGGSSSFSPKIFFEQESGAFLPITHPELEKDSKYEDLGSLFYDYDNDGDMDLFVVSGGNEFPENSKMYEDRLYENLGAGRLKRTSGILPTNMLTSGMRVIAEDFNGDGFKDLLIGGRVVPGKYPYAPKSYYLQYDGSKYVDKTAELAPEFANIGMVTDLKAFDNDNDGDLDIIIVGEWMSPTIMENNSGKFSIVNSLIPEDMEGWWYSTAVEDLDGDGDLDIVLGNLGWNNKFHPEPGKPLQVYSTDFDGNNTNDIVLAKYQDETLFPVRGKECSSEQMPFISQKFDSYENFANADLNDIFTQDKLDKALKLEAKTFSSGILWNDGGTYSFSEFPPEAQFSTINDILIIDIDKDGVKDIVLAGNNYSVEVETTRYDSSNGLILLNKGNKKFKSVIARNSGFDAPGNAKDMVTVKTKDGSQIILISNSNQIIQAFELMK